MPPNDMVAVSSIIGDPSKMEPDAATILTDAEKEVLRLFLV